MKPLDITDLASVFEHYGIEDTPENRANAFDLVAAKGRERMTLPPEEVPPGRAVGEIKIGDIVVGTIEEVG